MTVEITGYEDYAHGSMRKWLKPFGFFFVTFTVVMTILIVSIDPKGHRYIHFNTSSLLDFENLAQDSARVVSIIRELYLEEPNSTGDFTVTSLEAAPSHIIQLFQGQANGVFIECGAYTGGVTTGTEWLERSLGWKGLLTQPHPGDYSIILSRHRPRSHTANVCISPTKNPKHASFRNTSLDEGNVTSVTKVPCFPVYSLLLSFNATDADLLILNLLSAEYQVLRTIPFALVRIRVLSLVNSEENICCSEELVKLLRHHGYEQDFTCPFFQRSCFFVHSQWYKRNSYL